MRDRRDDSRSRSRSRSRDRSQGRRSRHHRHHRSRSRSGSRSRSRGRGRGRRSDSDEDEVPRVATLSDILQLHPGLSVAEAAAVLRQLQAPALAVSVPGAAPLPTLTRGAVAQAAVAAGVNVPGLAPAPMPVVTPVTSCALLVTHFPLAVAQSMQAIASPFGPVRRFRLLAEGAVPGLSADQGAAVVEYASMLSTGTAAQALPTVTIGPHRLQVQPLPESVAESLLAGAPVLTGDVPVVLAPTHAHAHAQPAVLTMAPSAPAPAAAPTSTVLRLGNLASEEDIADEACAADMQSDVRTECERYGPVVAVVVPLLGRPGAGFVFAKFGTEASAAAAAAALCKRTFGGAPVAVRYFPEDAFLHGQWTVEPL